MERQLEEMYESQRMERCSVAALKVFFPLQPSSISILMNGFFTNVNYYRKRIGNTHESVCFEGRAN